MWNGLNFNNIIRNVCRNNIYSIYKNFTDVIFDRAGVPFDDIWSATISISEEEQTTTFLINHFVCHIDDIIDSINLESCRNDVIRGFCNVELISKTKFILSLFSKFRNEISSHFDSGDVRSDRCVRTINQSLCSTILKSTTKLVYINRTRILSQSARYKRFQLVWIIAEVCVIINKGVQFNIKVLQIDKFGYNTRNSVTFQFLDQITFGEVRQKVAISGFCRNKHFSEPWRC